MSSGAQVELDWAAIDAAQGGESVAVGSTSGAAAQSYPSDEEILGIEPVGQASACPPDGAAGSDPHRLKPVPQTPGPDSAATEARSPEAANDTEDLRAFREMFPGGAAEALALREAAREVESLRQSAQELRQAAQAVDQIDAAIFSGDARAQSQVVADLARANPAAFRQLFAEAARVLAGMGPASLNDFTASARNEASRPGGARNPSVGVADVLEQQRDSSSSPQAGAPRNDSAVGRTGQPPASLRAGESMITSHEAPFGKAQGERGTLRQASGQAGHPPSPKDGFGGQARQDHGNGGQAGHEALVTDHGSRVTNNGFDAAAYANFERGTNDAVARDVRAAIGDTLGRVLPEGIVEGAARRIGDDIFNEIHRTLAADRTLSEQVGDVLQGWRFGAAEQQRVASLLAGRARQLVPGVARRVVGEWTSSVLGTARNKAARQAAAAARVDIAAPGGSLDSMPLRPIAARGVDYGSMSDDEILSM